LTIVDIKRFSRKNQNSPQPAVFIAIAKSIRYYLPQRSIFVALTCFKFLTVIALASLIAAPGAIGQDAGDPQAPTQDNSAPSKEQVKACLKRSDGAECLDKLFREMLKTHSTVQALELIQRFETEDQEIVRDCHPVVHAVGRETFRLKGNIHDAFSACDQTCHSGCYHGSVERFLRGEEIYAQANRHPTQTELKQKAATACDPKLPSRLRFQCLHGLGHALLYFSRYRLVPSLQVCDALDGDWSRESCYGGVFMENVFNSTPETRDLSPTDYHYPCDKLNDKYRGECYVMQTSRMVEMGLSTEEIFQECAKAGAYGAQCSVSVGRDLSNQVRLGDAASAARKCELAQGDNRQSCVRGVVYALIDNTWDGRYALPFCAALTQEKDQNRCWQESFQYLKYAFEKPADEIGKECGRLADLSRRCADLATQ
jgi:hypothetical protein